MRSSLALLAGLAGSALALPTASPELDARTLGLLGGVVDTVKDLLQGTSPAHIVEGISSEAAAALSGGALGCKAGSIDLEYRKKLVSWLQSGAGANFEDSLKKALVGWCQGSADLEPSQLAQLSFFIPTLAGIAAENDLYVTVEGVFSLGTEVVGVLTATAQSALEAAIDLLGEIDWKVRSALEFCAAGGVIGDLDVEVINALKAWLNSNECSLSASLKKTVLSWTEGKIGGDVIKLPSLPVGGVTAISIGKSLEALLETTGALVGSSQASLSGFLESDAGLDIEAEIKDLLQLIAKGGLAVDVELGKRSELALWLASDKCTLTAELKGLISLWLSIGVDSGSEVSVDLSTGLIGDLTGFITGTIDSLLGTQLHGLLQFLLSGKGVLTISLEARAQLAALITGGCGTEIDLSIQKIIIGWLSGCQKCTGGSTPSNIPARPISTPTSKPIGASTSAGPAESTTPCDTLTSNSVTSHLISESEAPSASTPATPTDVEATTTPAPAESTSTPCDTLTSNSVTSHVISESQAPSASTTTPVVVQPSESSPAESTTPCDTLTSNSVTSHLISESEAPSASTPATPTDVEATTTPAPAESTSTPCDTLTSNSVTSHVISESQAPSASTTTPVVVQPTESSPAESSSTPCDTLTSNSVTSTVISQSEAPSASAPTTTVDVQPSETIPAVPAESSSTPCETLVSDSVTSHVISEAPTPTDVEATGAAVPAESSSTPCETLVSDSVTSHVIPETFAPAITQAPAPSSGSLQTITVTKTVGVASCPPQY